jgi:hypothetical protein
MGKKNGIVSLVAGLALGAAAMFLSKKENRDHTVLAAKKAKLKATKALKTAKSETKKAINSAKKEGNKVVKIAKAKKRKLSQKVSKIAKK